MTFLLGEKELVPGWDCIYVLLPTYKIQPIKWLFMEKEAGLQNWCLLDFVGLYLLLAEFPCAWGEFLPGNIVAPPMLIAWPGLTPH